MSTSKQNNAGGTSAEDRALELFGDLMILC